MASLCKKRGASGALSPFWQAVISFQGRKVWISTKCTDKAQARAVGERWSRAAWLAQRWELNQTQADKLLASIAAITKNPQVAEQSRDLCKRLMAETTGEVYAGEDFSVYCKEWLEARRPNTAKSTLAKYEAVVTGFVESLPEKRRSSAVSSITQAEVRRYRDQRAGEGLSESTVNVEISILRGLFNSARREGICLINVAEAVERLKGQDVDERQAFSDSQIRVLLQVADQEWRGMILLAACAGLRLTDAANLKWNNVDLVSRLLAYQQRKTSHRKKRKSERTTVLYLHDDLVSYLEKIVPSTDDPSAPLFPTLHGKPSSGSVGLSSRFGKVMAKAGIVAPMGQRKSGRGRQFRALTFHSLRHSFVTRLANAEVSFEVRKQMVGHSSDAIHAGYSHLDVNLQKSAIAKLGSVLPSL